MNFKLTNDQSKSLNQINKDLTASTKMFRLLQGDVGSGKTIIALLSAYNTVNSGYQVAFMAPTEILARQHYNLAKKIFPENKIVELISGKSDYKNKKIILDKLENNQIDITARMRQMSTQLRHQNEESQALYKEASEDLNEYISLLNNMKTMMHDIDSKLIDIKKRSAVSE